MIRPILPVLSLALLTATANAQFFELELSEVLVIPSAGDHQKIELGMAHIPVDLTGCYISIDGTNIGLPAMTLPGYSSTVIHLNVGGTSNIGHIYLPSTPPLTAASSIALFKPGLIPGTHDLVSYLDWGGALGPNIAQAVQEGSWTSIGDSAPVQITVGATLANRRICRNAGNLFGPDAWYEDTTPTIGSENDSGCTVWYGHGCQGSNDPSWGVPGSWDTGPWTGEQLHLVISNATQPALVVASGTQTAPVDLTSIGMPGCLAHLTLEALTILPSNGSQCHFVLNVPQDPLLVGYDLHLQAFVPVPNANNALGGLVTKALRGTVGSR